MNDKKAMVNQITWAGFLINLVLSIFKILAGFIGNSQAVIADGVHSMSDMATDVAILVGVKYWSQPPDESHPHGHGRIETLITMFIGIVLALVAFGLAYRALGTLRESHTKPPENIALIAAILSIILKEFLYQWTIAVGRKIKSSAVVANAWHHRSDAFSSIPVTIAVIGAKTFPGWLFLDHVGAIVVTIFIIQAAWKIIVPALQELADKGAPPEIHGKIGTLSMSIDGVKDVHKIRTRKLGSAFQVDLHVLVNENLTVREGHRIGSAVKYKLIQEGPDVVDVIVHIEPFLPEKKV